MRIIVMMRHHSAMNRRSLQAGPWVAAGLVLAVLLGPVMAARAQGVVKCVDGDGNVTYQDSNCTGGQAGRPVTLPKAESRDEASLWEGAAKEARVTVGMPKRWVLRARGTPVEIRPATARDNATEIWRYAPRDGVTLLVGFAGSNVAWLRDDAAGRDKAPAGATATPSATPGTPAAPAITVADGSTRGAQNRRFVIAGRYCEHVFAEIGTADRQEALQGTNAGIRYFYEPQSGDPKMRTAFSCIGGKVADVDRTMVP
jgi:hypothetical protein